jgi:hypothetical protein
MWTSKRPSTEFRNLTRPMLQTCLAVAAMSMTARAGVLVVDAAMGPGADYANVFDALDWAVPNDVIVVRPGNYTASALGHLPNAVYITRAVTIVAESSPPLLSGVLIENLPANERVVFRGIEFQASPFGSSCSEFEIPKGLQITNCAGSVLIEDCTFVLGRPSILVQQSTDVTLSRCEIYPTSYLGTCFATKSFPGRGIEIEAANVNLHSCEVHGGDGANASPAAHTPGIEGAKPGGVAIRVDGGELFLGNTAVVGGSGGNGTFDGFGSCYEGAVGGVGLQVTSSGGLVRSLGSTILGGVSGISAGTCAPPATAAATELIAGSLVPLTGASNTLIGPPPSLEGAGVSIAVTAPPGHSVVALLSATFHSTYQPAGTSILHVGPQAVVLPLGLVPGSGTISLATTVPSLVPPDSSIQVFLQAANVSPTSGTWRLGSPSVAVVFDP